MAQSFNDSLFENNTQFTQALDYDGGSAPVYIGEAQAGAAKGDTVWRIKKLTYSGTNVTDVQWASGTNNFDKEWDERAAYSYS